MDLAEHIYRITRAFPREEAYGMTAQLRRSAVSIPANIAEGYGRAQRRSFIQFLRIAQGSLKELQTHAILCRRIGLLLEEQYMDIDAACAILGKRLVTLVRSLDRDQKG